jgi:ubiquinone/menaquinone biosynthesis C-methylase UbiE
MDQKTINTYNELANEYDQETIDFWERFPSTFFNTFIGLVKGKKVLDVGSGPGRDGLILQKAGASVICLDASESMVKLSASRGLESVLGDFNALPFDSASFDGIWAYTSLLHVPKTEIGKPIAEIRRVLKPDGVFALGMIEGDAELYRESSGVGKPRWFSFYQKEEIENILQQNGFKQIYFEEFQVKTKNYLNYIAQKV